MIRFLLLLSTLLTLPSWSMTLRERLKKAAVGDYVVLSHKEHTSLLVVTHTDENEVWIEERSPAKAPPSWKEWIAHPTPAPTSWLGCRIHLHSPLYDDCYSFTEGSWVSLDGQVSLFSLLDLPQRELPLEERKHLGAKASAALLEQRPLWNPPHIIHGTPVTNPHLTATKASISLPSDDSLEIESYYTSDAFPFPLWIEWKEIRPVRIRAIDSGNNPLVEKREIPKHPLAWKGVKKGKEGLTLEFRAKSSYSSLHLFAIHLSSAKQTIAVPFKSSNADAIVLDQKQLDTLLVPGEQYQWFLVPDATPEWGVESPPFRF